MQILAAESYQYLAKNFLKRDKELHETTVERKKFPDGELYLKISDPEKIHGDDIAIIGDATNLTAISELYNIACEVVDLGCRSLQIVIPYLAYAAQEQANEKGEIIIVKNIARMLSSIPKAKNDNRIYLVDVHNEIIKNFFETGTRVSCVSTKNLIKKVVNEISEKFAKEESLVLASVDMGRAQLISEIADELNLSRIFIEKKRISPKETQIISVTNENISGKVVVIYDDMIRTGSSLLNASEYFRKAGAKKIFAIISHGVFADGALEKIENSHLIDKIFCFNTHPNIFKQSCESKKFLEIRDISEVLCKNISMSQFDMKQLYRSNVSSCKYKQNKGE